MRDVCEWIVMLGEVQRFSLSDGEELEVAVSRRVKIMGRS
jgi:hypothetical protein